MPEESGVWDCQIFVTFQKEYLVRGRACLRIRDRTTGHWGPVLPNRVLGSVPREECDPEFVCDVAMGAPRVGERLCIQVGGVRVVSTPILAIEYRRVGDQRRAGQLRASGADWQARHDDDP